LGRRIAQGLPVRGQRTKTNAQTAKKLNRVERRRFSTYVYLTLSGSALTCHQDGISDGKSLVLTHPLHARISSIRMLIQEGMHDRVIM
jgi:hypothetical protein